jgi:N-acetylmuramoyl-L-alanine amidase
MPHAVAPCLLVFALAAAAPAQAVLFFRQGNLVAVAHANGDLATAVQRLCAGPTPGEAALGLSTALPAGTPFVAARRQGTQVELVFGERLLAARTAGALEAVIEQITKTARSFAGITDVDLYLRRTDGAETTLTAALRALEPPLTVDPTSRAASGGIDNPTAGALSGRRIVLSPGHGYYWHSSLGWTTQRGVIDGLLEDRHTAEIVRDYLAPALENLGAEVIVCRERGRIDEDRLADNDGGAPGYLESGGWSTSGSSGYNGGTYRFAATSAVPTATATFTLPVPRDGIYPVYAWFRASTNRAPDARYTIWHSGGSTAVTADQTRDDLTWVFLGEYWFTAAQGARIVLDNASSVAGRVVIADAVRIGGGRGSISRGSGTSNQPRWFECSRYWAQFAGAPASVWDSIAGGEDNDDDVTCRPRFAEWRGADLFLSLHTNAGGGAGTETYMYTTPTAGSAVLRGLVQTQLVGDLRAGYDPAWVDRGTASANFGEVRLLSTMPGVLCELAFHDTPGSLDHRALHDPEFRYLAGRALARAVLRYFAAAAPFPPEPPVALRVVQDGARGLRVAWDPAAGAVRYTVETSPDGKGFVESASVVATSWSTGPLPHNSLWSFRVRAWNASGRSFPTEVLCAGTDHTGTATLLCVQGFDRFDRYVKADDNTRDYLRLHGDAIRRDASFSLGFDAASNEAVQFGRVSLGTYRAVDWALGEESTADETFGATEQALVQNYLAAGGRLLLSGAEIGWDLDANGTAADRAFYRNVLGASYVADDAAVYTLQAGLAGTVSAGLPASAFDNGTNGTYDVDWPDVLAPADARSAICLRYGNGLVAGIQKVDPTTGARIVNLGLPIETITQATVRAQLVRQALAFLLAPLPLTAPAIAPIGQRLQFAVAIPPDAGFGYWLLCSDGIAPPIPLPGGGELPLRDSFLIPASLDPGNPFFGSFLGTLGPGGTAAPWVDLPVLSFLIGWDFWFSGITLESAVLAERRVWNWVRVRVVP